MQVKLSELSAMGAALRVLRKFTFLDAMSQRVMAGLANGPRRNALNRFHNRLTYDEKGVFHSIFYKAFSKDARLDAGVWTADFLGKTIKLPLRREMAWLDWQHASAILGHDVDVKQTYETLIKSEFRPRIFFDIGANYGMHSLLFLAHGIETVSFEPNPLCKAEFEVYCRLNDFDGQMESTALGSENGELHLMFPEKAAWLGKVVNPKTAHDIDSTLKKVVVSVVTLDQFAARTVYAPDLIKIDAEGSEVAILRGASETINRSKPLIIFESNELNDKRELWDTVRLNGYEVSELPLLGPTAKALSYEEFDVSQGFNFIGIPAGHPIIEKR